MFTRGVLRGVLSRQDILITAGGGGQPAIGTVILGVSNTGTTNEDHNFIDPTRIIFNVNALTASWAESDGTTTVASIVVTMGSYGGGNIKGYLYDSTGVNLLGVTNSTAVGTGQISLSFPSPPTISKGTSYILAFKCDAAQAINWYRSTTADGNTVRNYDGTGYAENPASISGAYTDFGAAGLIEIWAVH